MYEYIHTHIERNKSETNIFIIFWKHPDTIKFYLNDENPLWHSIRFGILGSLEYDFHGFSISIKNYSLLYRTIQKF